MVGQSELDTVLGAYWTNSPWLALTNAVGLGTSNIVFRLTDPTIGSYTVETSTNLVDWQPLGPASPAYGFADTNSWQAPQRFYRLHWP